MLPNAIEREPQELLPAMPPSVHCADVLTSTGNHSPWGFSQALSASRTMPGSTVTVRASSSNATTPASRLLWSTTSARPTVWPHCELPAPRGSIGMRSSRQTSNAARTSSCDAGTSTPTGSTW